MPESVVLALTGWRTYLAEKKAPKNLDRGDNVGRKSRWSDHAPPYLPEGSVTKEARVAGDLSRGALLHFPQCETKGCDHHPDSPDRATTIQTSALACRSWGSKSTGIYCRPVCPARTPKFEHCTFYESAAAAQEAGFRPCLRCRPETAPQLASWRGTSNTVSRALALINDGALDAEDSNVAALAYRVGVGERQLRRLLLQHLGASPIAVPQTRRTLFAKQLIYETDLAMTEVAMAAGFNSLRRFNEVFQPLFERAPNALRRKASISSSAGGTVLRVRYRPPYDWESMLRFLAARAIAGVEQVEHGIYRRTVELDGNFGTIAVKHLPRRQSLSITIQSPNVQALHFIVNRVRRVFDLNADINTIDEHLSRDAQLHLWAADTDFGKNASGTAKETT